MNIQLRRIDPNTPLPETRYRIVFLVDRSYRTRDDVARCEIYHFAEVSIELLAPNTSIAEGEARKLVSGYIFATISVIRL